MSLQNENRLRPGLLLCAVVPKTVLAVLIFVAQLSGQLSSLVSDSERIHFGDIVDIDVVGSLDHDWRGGLTPEGMLEGVSGLEEPVFALCKTESEVAALIQRDYSRFLKNPIVVVRVIDRSNRAVAYINGAVRTPQRLQIRRPVTLAEVIVFAGGITDSSNGQISIFRPPNTNCLPDPSGPETSLNKPIKILVNISDLLAGVDGSNPMVVSGDIVTVTQAAPVFLTGDIARRGRMNLTPELTLGRAIAAAGGIRNTGRGRKVRIYRRRMSNGAMEFDFRAIREGTVEDPILEPYDVIDVEDSGRPTRKPAPLADGPGQNGITLSKLPLRIVD